MEKWTRVLTKIAEKIFRVLDVFDFSYIISGATSCVLIYLYFLFTDNQDVLLKLNEIRWYIVILIAYILGLIMFATGRFIRQEILGGKKRKYDLFVDYGITNKTDEEIDALFCKYWDKLQNSETSSEYEYYKRLWVMTAVYEGLIGVWFYSLLFSILNETFTLPSVGITGTDAFLRTGMLRGRPNGANLYTPAITPQSMPFSPAPMAGLPSLRE